MSAEATRGSPTRPVARRGPVQAITAPGLDYVLIAIIATLLGLGLFMVYSASFPGQGSYFFLRQIAWVAIGIVACTTVSIIPYGWWKKLAVPLMFATLLILLAVLALGGEHNGATRHLLGGSLQPSEIAKFTVTIYVAAWVAGKGARLAQFEDGLLPFVVIIGLVAGLIALERSFSVTIIVLTIGLVIFFVGGGNGKQLGLLILIGTPILAVAMVLSGYPMDRFREWYAVHFDPSSVSQETLRILEMLRSGRGIGTDPSFWQSKLGVSLLWSDYLFANIGADLHFPGTCLVLALYAGLAYRGLGIALNARDRFAALTAFGLTTWITVQAAVHIGASLMLIPTTGQPLPLMSYGGSSLLSCMVAAGLLLSISRSETEKKAVYAHFGFGWRDWRPRLPHPRRRQRAEGDDRPLDRTRRADARPANRRNAVIAARPGRKAIGKGGSGPATTRRAARR